VLGVTFTRVEAEIVGVLIILAALLMWLGFHDAKVAHTATAPILAAVDAASAAQTAQAKLTDAEQAEALHETTVQNTATLVDARAIAATVDGLRDDAVRGRAARQATRPAEGSQAGIGDAPDLVHEQRLSDGFESAFDDTAEDAASLALAVRQLTTSGGLCRDDYSAAQVKP
jgi:hypothetical protein